MNKKTILVAIGLAILWLCPLSATGKSPKHGVKPEIGRTTGYWAKVERVVDGDTVVAGGVKYRLSMIDTPEIHAGKRSGFQCDAERRLGELAKIEAEILLLGRKVWIKPTGKWDRYQRPLVTIRYRRGQWYGEHMIRARLAVRWQGRKHKWCD